MGDAAVTGLAVLVALAAVAAVSMRMRARRDVVLHEWEWGLLYADGRFGRVLEAGRYNFWPLHDRREVHRIGRNPQHFASAPMDMMTSERFVFRLAVTCIYRVTDPRAAFENPIGQRLRIAVQATATEFVAARTLDEALADQAGLIAAIMERLKAEAPDVEMQSVLISSLNLPPEVRRMYTEVERAKREGLAALERAHGEQAALRALANAARLLKNNPELMRLRTLQALSPTGKGATLVLGQDAILASGGGD